MMFTITLSAVYGPIPGASNDHSAGVKSFGLVAVNPAVSSISFAVSYVPLPLFARLNFKVYCMQIGNTGFGKILNQPLIDSIIPDITDGCTIEHIASFLQKLVMVDCGLWYQYESHASPYADCCDINKWASVFTNFARLEQVHVQQLDNILTIRKIKIPQNAQLGTSLAVTTSASQVGPQPYPDKKYVTDTPQTQQAKLIPQNGGQSLNLKSPPMKSAMSKVDSKVDSKVEPKLTEEYRDGGEFIAPSPPTWYDKNREIELNPEKPYIPSQKRTNLNAFSGDQAYSQTVQPSFKRTLVSGASTKPFYGEVISTSTSVDVKVGPGLSTSFSTSVSASSYESSYESSITNNIQIKSSVANVTSNTKNVDEEDAREPFGELIDIQSLFECDSWGHEGGI